MNLDNITDIEIDGIDMTDYPDFCDAFITSATWIDSGEELTEEELDKLHSDHPDFVYDKVVEYIH